MPEYSYLQTFVPIEEEDFHPIIQRFSALLQSIHLWNDEYEEALSKFSWDIEDGGFVYSTTTGLSSAPSHLSPILLKPFVLGLSDSDQNSLVRNFLAIEFLIESEDLRSLRMWRYYPSTFQLVRKLANLLFEQFPNSVVYFCDEAQDGQDFENLKNRHLAALWKFDYALVPNNCLSLYPTPPSSHQIFYFDHFAEVFFIDKWEIKSLESMV